MVNCVLLWAGKEDFTKIGISLALALKVTPVPSAKSSNHVHMYPRSLCPLITVGERINSHPTSATALVHTFSFLFSCLQDLLLLLLLSPYVIKNSLFSRSFTLAYIETLLSLIEKQNKRKQKPSPWFHIPSSQVPFFCYLLYCEISQKGCLGFLFSFLHLLSLLSPHQSDPSLQLHWNQSYGGHQW